MTDWLLDTLVWTAGLIAVVLVVRRPVARWFGPQIAYALWALPAMRVLLPPVELPAWLAPAPEPEPSAAADQVTFLFVEPSALTATTGAMGAAPASAMPVSPLPIVEIGVMVWLVGAAIFLTIRFGNYFKLRRELLVDAREVGREGRVRMVETDRTDAPLALGVLDPVIVMPEGFISQPDKAARDLAIAHELAHHKGRDLLVNFLIQPLFALHWFNPLARYGWLALRRDQEAACDARVMASKPAEERAVYADLIAGFATGPNVTLAAPMACPVLGDKSIIHRLRSLNMSNLSNRRRVAGRALIGAAVLALPLTASISYAESQAVPQPPAPPTPPGVTATVPQPPAPPVPPAPLTAPAPPTAILNETIVVVDPDTGEETTVDVEADTEEDVIIERISGDTDSRRQFGQTRRIRVSHTDTELSDEQVEEIMAEVREGLAEAQIAINDMPMIISEAMAASDHHGRTKVRMECRGEKDDVAHVKQRQDGHMEVYICRTRVMAHALSGLREAREAISNTPEIEGKLRENLLDTLDQQIREWETTQQS